MANINKITVNGTTYDIEDTTARASSGLTDDIKTALLNCFEKVAWIDADGQSYYDALESALYPPTNLSSISCVYTQSGTVYNTDSLDSLKSDLVVTAHYDDSSIQTVTTYTLSGSLRDNIGTTTITVAYGGKTTTFTVTVTADTSLMYYLYNHEFAGVINDTSDSINSNIKLTDTDKTFTLLLDADSEGMAHTYWRLFSAIQSASPYNGIYYGARSTTNSYDMLKWISQSKYQLTPFDYAYVGRIRMALTHTSGSGSLAYKIKVDDNTTVSGTISSTFTATDVYLYVGGDEGQRWGFKGTMDLFEVYDKVMTSSEINDFLGDA